MTVTNIEKDPSIPAMTLTAEFDAAPSRVWRMWSDPRQLERWWGPPSHPATVVEHDLQPGGRVAYFMTSPEGERFHGYWRILVVETSNRLEFEDGFADADGQPNPELPTSLATVTLRERTGGGTTMTLRTTFPSVDAMEQLLSMGMEEGITLAVNQIDGLLAA